MNVPSRPTTFTRYINGSELPPYLLFGAVAKNAQVTEKRLERQSVLLAMNP